MKTRHWFLVAGCLALVGWFFVAAGCGGDDDDDDNGDDTAGDDAGEECTLDEPCARLVECDFYSDEDFCAEAVVSDCLDAEGRRRIVDCFCACIDAATTCEEVNDCMDCVSACWE